MPVVSLNEDFELLLLAAVDGKAPLATGEDDDDEVPGKNKHAVEEKEVNFAMRSYTQHKIRAGIGRVLSSAVRIFYGQIISLISDTMRDFKV